MDENISPLHKRRLEYRPAVPNIFRNVHRMAFEKGEAALPLRDTEEIHQAFPKTCGQPILLAKDGPLRTPQPVSVGVVFSGGQAAGGHNVIGGLFDTLKSLHPANRVIGFVGGPNGILEAKHIEIHEEMLRPFRNQGGFDLIGSGRTKIESAEQLHAAAGTMKQLDLMGLVVIGGDDSNTNAAVMAEYFLNNGCKTKVIGVPKTIDGDLKSKEIAISFGFDTACKVYAEMIGNICRDTLSARKYYHFIKVMGRSASHIALECALNTHPNYVFLSEEVEEKNVTLAEITRTLSDLIANRAKEGKNYGVVLIPEGLIEFIPEMKSLMGELNKMEPTQDVEKAKSYLTPKALSCFEAVPRSIQEQFLIDRDPHGNVQVSQIETEVLLMEAVRQELERRKLRGAYTGKFQALKHFFGYEGRAALPSNFDATYCYALGAAAALLIDEGATGYLAFVKELACSPECWKVGGFPITALMHMELRKKEKKPVVKKSLVDLKGKPFRRLEKERDCWMYEDCYRYPGPIQYFGEPEIVDSIPRIVKLEQAPCD